MTRAERGELHASMIGGTYSTPIPEVPIASPATGNRTHAGMFNGVVRAAPNPRTPESNAAPLIAILNNDPSIDPARNAPATAAGREATIALATMSNRTGPGSERNTDALAAVARIGVIATASSVGRTNERPATAKTDPPNPTTLSTPYAIDTIAVTATMATGKSGTPFRRWI